MKLQLFVKLIESFFLQAFLLVVPNFILASPAKNYSINFNNKLFNRIINVQTADSFNLVIHPSKKNLIHIGAKN